MSRFTMTALVGWSAVGSAAAFAQEEPPLAHYFGFMPAEIYKLDQRIQNCVIADVNGDGLQDIVIVNNLKNRIDVLQQRKDGQAREEQPADVNDIPLNLTKIKRRAMAFWLTVGGAILLSICLFLLKQMAVAKVVAFAGVILGIATWMAAMMSFCSGCRASFHEGYPPRAWPRFGCAHCGLGFGGPRNSEATKLP